MDDQQAPPPEQTAQEIIAPSKPKRKHGGGNPKHKRTEHLATAVAIFSGMNWSRYAIAEAFDVDAGVIKDYYEHEFLTGKNKLKAKVAMKIMELLDKGCVLTTWRLENRFNVLGEEPVVDKLKRQYQITAMTPEDAQFQYDEELRRELEEKT